ncbi:MAG: cytochrome c [Nitrospirae bacterium]|nr:cytochrome c [Nitrospirota bacterium]
MATLIISLIIVAALAVLFGWLARRAWLAHRAWLKWPGVALAGIFTLLMGCLVVVGARGTYKLYARHSPLPAIRPIEITPGRVARGQMIAASLCAACHATNGGLPLSGGRSLSDDAGLPLGDVYPPNVTPGGTIQDWTDAELFRVIRTGVNREGRSTVMSMLGSRLLSDEDTECLVAYLRSAQSVQNETPAYRPTLLLALFIGAGLMPIDPAPAVERAAPPRAVTPEYGKYVLDFVSCDGCHGPKLDGRAPPPNPPAPNLTLIMPRWSKEDFFKAMRTGVTPDGQVMKDTMPWRAMGQLEDMELEALYVTLHALEPIP